MAGLGSHVTTIKEKLITAASSFTSVQFTKFPKKFNRGRHDREHPEREPAAEAEAGRVEGRVEGHGRQADGFEQAVQERSVAFQPFETSEATATAAVATTAATATTASTSTAAASTTTAATTPAHAFSASAAAAAASSPVLPRYQLQLSYEGTA